MTRTDTSNGALTRSAGVCRKRIPKRDTHSCRPRLTGLPYVPGPMLFSSPEAPARVVPPSALRPARRSQRATLGLVGPTRVEGHLEEDWASRLPSSARRVMTPHMPNTGSWDYPAGSSRQRLLSRISMRAVRPADHIAAGREVRYRG